MKMTRRGEARRGEERRGEERVDVWAWNAVSGWCSKYGSRILILNIREPQVLDCNVLILRMPTHVKYCSGTVHVQYNTVAVKRSISRRR